MRNIAVPANRRPGGIFDEGRLHQAVRIEVEERCGACLDRQKKRRHVRSFCDFTFPELVLPAKTHGSSLPGKLVILKRRKLELLNLPNKFLLFGP